MTKALQGFIVALGLVAASPAFAQPRGYYGGPARYRPVANNALRLQIGGAGLAARYCPDGTAGPCFDSDPWEALVLSGELDLGLGGPLGLTLGAREVAAPYYSGNPSIFEPYVGMTFKFARGMAPIEPRLSAGVALLLGDNEDTGGALRVGGGLSFFGHAPIGLALDLAFEFGRLGDVDVSQVQFLIGPEFRF